MFYNHISRIILVRLKLNCNYDLLFFLEFLVFFDTESLMPQNVTQILINLSFRIYDGVCAWVTLQGAGDTTNAVEEAQLYRHA